MVRRIATATVTASVLAFACACSSASGSPTSPAAPPATADAAADGSTLKVTAPALVSPIDTVQLDTLAPTFVLTNASARFGETPALTYRIEISTPTGTVVHTAAGLAAGSGSTTWTIPTNLDLDADFRWRTRAEFNTSVGPWSGYGTFRSLDYRGLNPRPENGLWPSTGNQVVSYITAAWPSYLAPTNQLSERIENMEFVRDRFIEAGICGGLDFALNQKRGVGPLSHDAIAWRTPDGEVEVIDIAVAFDDESNTMELQFAAVGGVPGYDPYPNHPGC